MARYLYSELAARIQARKTCLKNEAIYHEWSEKHTKAIHMLTDLLPNDAKIDLDSSHADKLIFYLSFHHMNDGGFWDGYTDHTVVVTPSLQFGFNLRISGRDRDDVKDLLHQEFEHILRQDVTYELYRDQFPDLAVTSKWEDKDGNPSQCYQAWYSSGVRFWNDLNGAKKHAADLMEKKFFGR